MSQTDKLSRIMSHGLSDKTIHLLEAYQNQSLVLVNQYQNIYEALKQHNPNMADEELNALVLSVTAHQTQKMNNITSLIQDTLNTLMEHKRDAEGILNLINE